MIDIIQNKKKRKTRLCIFALLAMLILTTLLTPVLAGSHPYPDDYKTACYNLRTYADVGSFAETVFKWTCTANGTNPDFSYISAASNLTKLSQYGKLWSLVISIYDAAMVVGITMMVLYFFLGIMDKIQMDQFTTEQFLRKLIGLCIAIVVITNGSQIFQWIINISDALAADMKNALKQSIYNNSGGAFSPKGCYDALMGAGWLEGIVLGIGYIIDALPLYLIQMVTYVGIMFAMFSRALEAVIRFALAPIGLAPIVSDGLRSSGMRYLKQFASVCLQSVVIIAILYLNQRVCDDVNLGKSTIAYFAMPLVALGMVFKSRRIADDLIGV